MKNLKPISCRPVRNDWLKALYTHNLVEVSERTGLFTDKLYLYKALSANIKSGLHLYHPHTMGLREFFNKHALLTAEQELAPLEKIEIALRSEFPTEAVLKPTTVINTGGEKGLYLFSTNAILKALHSKQPELMQTLFATKPHYAELIDKVASGEEFLLQENIGTLAGYPLIEKAKHYEEIRIHTYEDDVIKGASFSRWSMNEIKNSQKFYWAQDFVQDFLNQLPKEFLAGQAWGLDLLVFDNGTIRILEINTNRGVPGQWTGFLSRPQLMGAYTRIIEKKKNVRFRGLSGILLRHDLGNITKHLKKKYIEGIR
ncbi:hypothetical protein [Bdellovibrio svalbardensis]|uniref:ATP-grasp domain-containing protein n=1 Tax=Bdellovibrio svalbardensis TaxID=2972972 RepID=A0ABT6DHL0_9BACT|nr:hypothetical protein [Bdellovibrio svalbardensis]MDG0816283.1 hypothetical protein [Bdellovibrio svalbardensis]